ncbi:MAG: hypothetical protein WB562_09240 [Candidatus Sulfotelmatobacter sp.]
MATLTPQHNVGDMVQYTDPTTHLIGYGKVLAVYVGYTIAVSAPGVDIDLKESSITPPPTPPVPSEL